MGLTIKLNNTTIAEVNCVQSVEGLQQIVCEKLVSGIRNSRFSSAAEIVLIFHRHFQNVLPEDFYFTQNGRKVTPQNTDELDLEASIQTIFRLLGGKGGFGSMLRAIGAQIEKTTNRDACRDLSGRRLRDINEEKRLKAWLEKQQDRESDQYARKKKKLERLLAKPRHEFKDEDYEQARSDLTANVDEAVEEGFRKAREQQVTATAAATKRKIDEAEQKAGDAKKPKKKTSSHLWIAADLSSGSDDETSASDSEEEKVQEKKKSPGGVPKEDSNSSVEK